MVVVDDGGTETGASVVEVVSAGTGAAWVVAVDEEKTETGAVVAVVEEDGGGTDVAVVPPDSFANSSSPGPSEVNATASVTSEGVAPEPPPSPTNPTVTSAAAPTTTAVTPQIPIDTRRCELGSLCINHLSPKLLPTPRHTGPRRGANREG